MNRYAARFWASFPALSLLLFLAACGGNDTTAATMHLTRTEGTVAVSDGTGKDVPVLENLGLYSGYGVDTHSESYAWINLDDVKLTKLDQESEIVIQKEGKVLEIEVKSGSLLFNVTQPLEDDETMSIRTSTMLIGIRGTCGWVEERNGLSRVYLLEGKVECSAGNQTVQVNAGEMAELTSNGIITVTTFTEQDVPAFVRDDLDPDLISGMGEVPGPDDPDTPETSDIPETTDIPETVDGEGELYYEPDNADDLLAALRSAPSGATITLANSIEVEKEVRIPNGTADKPVILDLNGYTLTVTGRYSFEVSGALLIRDTSSQGSGKLAGVSIIVSNSAYLNLVNGTITAGAGNAVRIDKNASFIMNGGTIENDDEGSDPVVEIYGDSASFTMNGGTIDGKYDAAVFLDRGSFTMKGGELTSHHIGTSATVAVIRGGTLELLGGTITNSYDGTYSNEWYGAVLHVQSPDTDIISFESTVIRSKKGIFIGYLADGSTWINWWPEGYTSTATPDADGYYYMTGE